MEDVALHRSEGKSLETPSGSRWMGALLCTISAAGFASLSVLVKLGYEAGFTLTGMLALRFGGAALLMAPLLILLRGRQFFPPPRLLLTLLALGGLLYAFQSSLYVSGLRTIPASLAGILLYIYPALVAFLNWMIYRKPPNRWEWIAMGLALSGVLLTLGAGNRWLGLATTQIDRAGVLFVLGATTCYAFYIIISNRYVHRMGPLVSTTWIAAGAAISFSALALASGGWRMELEPEAIWVLLGLVLFSTVVAFSAFFAGMRRVGTTTASLLSSMEPVFTVVLASVLLSERLALIQIIGGCLVLAAVLILARSPPAVADATGSNG